MEFHLNLDWVSTVLPFVIGTYFISLAWTMVYLVFKNQTAGWYELAGVIAAYLFLGLGYACYYDGVYQVDYGSFSGLSLNHDAPFSELVYFSFEILGTVGLGDISPKSSFARSISIVEAVSGVFYIAIIIAQFSRMFWEASNKKSD